MKLLIQSFRFNLSTREEQAIVAEINKLYPDGTEHEDLSAVILVLTGKPFEFKDVDSLRTDIENMNICEDRTPMLHKLKHQLDFASENKFLTVPK